jgi:hypothetical protein
MHYIDDYVIKKFQLKSNSLKEFKFKFS